MPQVSHEIRNTAAYWIDRQGEIHQVWTNHIGFVIEHPALFGLTLQQIKDVYVRYEEELGQEAQARHEIIMDLVQAGFIRIRRYRNQGYSVNVNMLDGSTVDRLSMWAKQISGSGINGMKEGDIQMMVNISVISEKRLVLLTVQELSELSGQLHL